MVFSIQQQLLAALQKVDRPGTFCASGGLPATLAGLEVVGLGPVALPLDKKQAAAIKKLARQAPYGKGTQTLVDTDVRRVWEIDAQQVTLANPEWPGVLKQALGTVQAELGLENQKLEAHLYKLLLYETGSFFLPHRDGEKLDRMVATLVIALPSEHQGGELIVRHEGREVTVDFAPVSRFQTQFAAFYADCEHEVRPVTSGFRLALVYNLVLEKSKRTITAPTSREHIVAVADLLRRWSKERPAPTAKAAAVGITKADSEPATKLAVLLDHQYTEAGLTYDALKGIDRAAADVLFAAARESECDVALALVTCWVSGSAEPSEDYRYGRRRRRYRDYDEDDEEEDSDGEHVMGEVYEDSLTASKFSDAKGNPLSFGEIPLSDGEIIAEQPIKDGQPTKEEYEGYTGNAGMTLERWYHRAAVVLWPAAARFDVLCETGVEAAVGGLEQMVQHWVNSKPSVQPTLKSACLKFASRIIANWPERKAGAYYGGYRSRANPQSTSQDRRLELHTLLEGLGEPTLVAAWISSVLVRDANVDPGKTLGDLCQHHGWTTFQEELRTLFSKSSADTLGRDARLLADWSLRTDKKPDRRTVCSELAPLLMSAVEGLNAKPADHRFQQSCFDPTDLFPSLIKAFLALNHQELLERLVTYILDRPKVFNLTEVQVPVLLGLEAWLRKKPERRSAALTRWLQAIVDELQIRVSQPPQAPTDWKRGSATGCSCANCKRLSDFLKDPDQKTFRFPLPESGRQHLQDMIRRQTLDTTHVTERTGRPYSLVFTKTHASFEREMKIHQVNLDQLAKVRQVLQWHMQS